MSATDGPATAPLPFGGVNPIFRVRSVVESMNYYVRVLGFKVDFHVPASGFASVSRGRCAIFLCEGDQGHFGGWVWIGVSDAARVFQEYAAKGAKVRHPPTNYEWAYEMRVEDPDGNGLR